MIMVVRWYWASLAWLEKRIDIIWIRFKLAMIGNVINAIMAQGISLNRWIYCLIVIIAKVLASYLTLAMHPKSQKFIFWSVTLSENAMPNVWLFGVLSELSLMQVDGGSGTWIISDWKYSGVESRITKM